MKLATFTQANATRVGVVEDDEIVDLGAAAPELPGEMSALLAAGPDALDAVRRFVAGGTGRLPLGDVKLEAPILRPPEFLAIGLNYADHIEETGMEKPSFPMFFNKQTSCVNGPFEPIHAPMSGTEKLRDQPPDMPKIVTLSRPPSATRSAPPRYPPLATRSPAA